MIPSFSLALFTLPLGELRERHYGTSKGGWTVGFSFEDVPLSARMADDGRAKRLKSSSQDGATVSAILVAYISSFLGTSQELISLGLTCRSFGWRQSASTLNWSFVEEVARQALCSRATAAEMDSLPQYLSGTTTWLSMHHIPALIDPSLYHAYDVSSLSTSRSYGSRSASSFCRKRTFDPFKIHVLETNSYQYSARHV